MKCLGQVLEKPVLLHDCAPPSMEALVDEALAA
jgi:hypothetical protein